MDDIPHEGEDHRLNRMVAITVVLLSIFLGLVHIKDGNIVRQMALAKADAVDAWGQYQATREKLHITQSAASQLRVLGSASRDPAAVAAEATRLAAQTAKYESESPQLSGHAKLFEAKYTELEFHHDQFDAADALIAIGISIAAVAALAEIFWVLVIAWGFGAFGVFWGVAGFAGLAAHPDFLAKLLG